MLQRGSDNESKLNDNYMKKKIGQVVLFGDIIQVNVDIVYFSSLILGNDIPSMF